MDKQEDKRILLNRVISFLVGGLLVFTLMSVTVVSSMKKQNTELTATLDTSRYEAGRLLADAKAQLESREYAKARESLSALLANQPGSAEAEEGRTMLAVITTAEDKANAKWEKASAAIQKKWANARAAEIRAESDKARAELEAGISEKINQEWEKAKDQVRADWENAG
jgi:predicted Zn-dependent protease